MLPPKLEDLPAGTRLVAGLGTATVIADFDFETYSPAGYIWNTVTNTFDAPDGATAKGLPAVGAAVYSEHPDAEVLSMAYDLKDGDGQHMWTPVQPPPWQLFEHLAQGGLLEAWNIGFERWIWENVCVPKYGWPPLPVAQLRCAQAKARAFGLPDRLAAAGAVLQISKPKDTDGRRLIMKFCVPQKPSKTQPKTRILCSDDPADFDNLLRYNLRDIAAEAEISSKIPDLTPAELEFWQYDQEINHRGVQADMKTINACISIVNQALVKYNTELKNITNGLVDSAAQIGVFKSWVEREANIRLPNFDKGAVAATLERWDLPPHVRRALEIRELIGSAAVKKPNAMRRQATKHGRLHDLFLYHGARTGRATGVGPQPQNLPNSGPDVWLCECGKHYGLSILACPWCGAAGIVAADNSVCKRVEWNEDAMEQAIVTLETECLALVEYFWGSALSTMFGCLRGLFIAAPGKRLICSDYSAIEAVVLAMISDEPWRIEVFRTHGKIYEAGAAKITGVSLDEILNHKHVTGSHHKARKVGKVSELASGYQGGHKAWYRFAKTLNIELPGEDEVKKSVYAWRDASPKIVALWKGLENAARVAILNPNTEQTFRGITYTKRGCVLYCRLLSGRYIGYYDVALEPGAYGDEITYWGDNKNPENGPIGWIKQHTYGGKLTENVVQAVARDILTHAIVNLERAGYPVVLHVHDEIVAEVPLDYGSVAEFEAIMSTMPDWAADWPIKAKGGFESQRYRK